MKPLVAWALAGVVLALPGAGAGPSSEDDRKIVADLDTRYQAAVKSHDAATMDRILADDFILVTGKGVVHTKAELLADLWGSTAVVTALVWVKGTDERKPFDYSLRFSDTYVRTPAGWRYVFGQAPIPLPPAP